MNLKGPLIVDVDGVLADFNSGFAKLLRKINPQVQLDIYAADFPNCWNWPTAYGFSAEDESKAWNEASNSGLFWESLFPTANAYADIDYLNWLQKIEKVDIYFATSRRGPTAKRETERWLAGRGFENPTVVVVKAHTKGHFCRAVGAALAIDDYPSNLMDIDVGLRALIKQPYNVQSWGIFDYTADSVREVLNAL